MVLSDLHSDPSKRSDSFEFGFGSPTLIRGALYYSTNPIGKENGAIKPWNIKTLELCRKFKK